MEFSDYESVCFLMVLNFFLFGAVLYLYLRKSDELKDAKIEIESWKSQALYSLKKVDEQKVRSYKRAEFSLKQAMVQQTQSDIAKRLQSYLSCEGLHAD